VAKFKVEIWWQLWDPGNSNFVNKQVSDKSDLSVWIICIRYLIYNRQHICIPFLHRLLVHFSWCSAEWYNQLHYSCAKIKFPFGLYSYNCTV